MSAAVITRAEFMNGSAAMMGGSAAKAAAPKMTSYDSDADSEQGFDAGSDADSEQGFAVRVKDFFIDMVNPKFKEYNKPCFLAVIVAVPTAILTLALFFIMLHFCHVETKTAENLETLQLEIESNCVLSALVLKMPKYKPEFFTCKINDPMVKYCEEVSVANICNQSETGAFTADLWMCLDEFAGHCYVFTSFAETVDMLMQDINDAECVCVNTTRVLTIPRRKPYFFDCKLAHVTYCPDEKGEVASLDESCDKEGDAGSFLAEVRVCPDELRTFGSALGYASFIELAITIVFVFALKRCGIIRGGREGYLGKMIKDIVDEKDAGSDMGAEVRGLIPQA